MLFQLGIDDTFKLGQFIGDRYVRTGFLRSPMSPSEIHFLSRANSRCTHSAALVGSGMWAKNGDEDQFNPVPIYSNVENDKVS
ncbi:hypothetical protein OESDEN_08371 [Oesophagostomum dentatum]|uniref:Uncharacterized protein n=1 Tax=Oesophagostomum dentatum TaxID=61180 RepID=A0A0B1T7I1_OESDE|nr:hypothetical protein OESDEN_08371 [Oesophagostomum dentatum]